METRKYRGWTLESSTVATDIYTPGGALAYPGAGLLAAEEMVDSYILNAPRCGNIEPHMFHREDWVNEHFVNSSMWCEGRCSCPTFPHHGPGEHK